MKVLVNSRNIYTANKIVIEVIEEIRIEIYNRKEAILDIKNKVETPLIITSSVETPL